MEETDSRRNAGLAILLTLGAYIAFAFLTQWKDYGLVAQPEGYLRWTVIRLSSVGTWLVVAALLLRYRRPPVNWRSFSYSFLATGIIAILFSPSVVPANSNYAAIAGTIGFYALASGFLCVTVRKPAIAAGLGLLLFPAQLLVDAIAHIFSGLFRLH